MKKIALLLLTTGLFSAEIFREKVPVSIQAPTADHKEWDTWLKKYVRGDGRVNYAAGKKDSKLVEDYLRRNLGTDEKKLKNQDEMLALFINLYNALTVYQVLKNHPVKSVMSGFPGGFFNGTFYRGGEKLTLDDLEKKIILKKFREPLVHFALNCASHSCPPLRSRAYTGAGLKRVLYRQTSDYLNKEEFVRIDEKNRAIHLVELFQWYEKDFGDFASFYNRYSGKKTDLKGFQKKYLKYDWSLNGN